MGGVFLWGQPPPHGDVFPSVSQVPECGLYGGLPRATGGLLRPGIFKKVGLNQSGSGPEGCIFHSRSYGKGHKAR